MPWLGQDWALIQKVQPYRPHTMNIVEFAVHILFVNHTRFGAAVIFIVACFLCSFFSLRIRIRICTTKARAHIQRIRLWWKQPPDCAHESTTSYLISMSAARKFDAFRNFVTHFRLMRNDDFTFISCSLRPYNITEDWIILIIFITNLLTFLTLIRIEMNGPSTMMVFRIKRLTKWRINQTIC